MITVLIPPENSKSWQPWLNVAFLGPVRPSQIKENPLLMKGNTTETTFAPLLELYLLVNFNN